MKMVIGVKSLSGSRLCAAAETATTWPPPECVDDGDTPEERGKQ